MQQLYNAVGNYFVKKESWFFIFTECFWSNGQNQGHKLIVEVNFDQFLPNFYLVTQSINFYLVDGLQ